MTLKHAIYLRLKAELQRKMVSKVQKVVTSLATMCKGVEEIVDNFSFVQTISKSDERETILVKQNKSGELFEILIV